MLKPVNPAPPRWRFWWRLTLASLEDIGGPLITISIMESIFNWSFWGELVFLGTLRKSPSSVSYMHQQGFCWDVFRVHNCTQLFQLGYTTSCLTHIEGVSETVFAKFKYGWLSMPCYKFSERIPETISLLLLPSSPEPYNQLATTDQANAINCSNLWVNCRMIDHLLNLDGFVQLSNGTRLVSCTYQLTGLLSRCIM